MNLSKNPEIRSLDFDSNYITAIDLSKLTNLESLNCSNNGIKKLDVSKNTKLKDGNEKLSADDMLKDILHDNELIQETLTAALEEAHKANDEAVASFLGERLCVHKKAAWFVRSTLN